MEAESYRDDIKNIEVYGSHSGLGANVSVLLITANATECQYSRKNDQRDHSGSRTHPLSFLLEQEKKEVCFFLN